MEAKVIEKNEMHLYLSNGLPSELPQISTTYVELSQIDSPTSLKSSFDRIKSPQILPNPFDLALILLNCDEALVMYLSIWFSQNSF